MIVLELTTKRLTGLPTSSIDTHQLSLMAFLKPDFKREMHWFTGLIDQDKLSAILLNSELPRLELMLSHLMSLSVRKHLSML